MPTPRHRDRRAVRACTSGVSRSAPSRSVVNAGTAASARAPVGGQLVLPPRGEGRGVVRPARRPQTARGSRAGRGRCPSRAPTAAPGTRGWRAATGTGERSPAPSRDPPRSAASEPAASLAISSNVSPRARCARSSAGRRTAPRRTGVRRPGSTRGRGRDGRRRRARRRAGTDRATRRGRRRT